MGRVGIRWVSTHVPSCTVTLHEIERYGEQQSLIVSSGYQSLKVFNVVVCFHLSRSITGPSLSFILHKENKI